MKIRHKLPIGLATVVFLISVKVSCAKPTTVSRRISVWLGYESLYLARDKGYYDYADSVIY